MAEPATPRVQKVYSPDITPYSLEGRSGIFGTLLSIIVAPLRITTRVMHNIFILPANMQESYGNSLLIVSIIVFCIGVVDLFMYHKWPMAVSQVPVILYALRLRIQARRSTVIAHEKREVDINVEEVENLCNTIYNDLDTIVKE